MTALGILGWLIVPVVVLIGAIVWASFRSRPARPAAMQESMDSFSKFRHALARPAPQAQARARARAVRDQGRTAQESSDVSNGGDARAS